MGLRIEREEFDPAGNFVLMGQELELAQIHHGGELQYNFLGIGAVFRTFPPP